MHLAARDDKLDVKIWTVVHEVFQDALELDQRKWVGSKVIAG